MIDALKTYKLSLFFAFFLFLYLPLQAQEKSKLELLIDKAYSIIEGSESKPRKNYFYIVPIWGISPETGIKLGASFGYVFKTADDSITRPSSIRLNTSYTQLNQFNIRPHVDIFFKQNTYNLKAQYVYNDFNEYFWGLGNSAPESAKELYNFKQQRFNARLVKQVFKNWYFGPQLMYEKLYKVDFSDLSTTQQNNIPGINGYEVLGAGLAFAFDNRNNVFFPTSGAYLEISNHMFMNQKLNSYRFKAVVMDLRKYISIGKKDVFAAQFFGSYNGGYVPYRQMPTIGNDMIMRGYYNGRYRDDHYFAMQAEYRKFIWGPVGAAVFAGFGNVGSNLTELSQNLKPNYGIGLRGLMIRKEHLNARIDIGFGEKNTRGVYFTIAEAF
ncbi:MAG: BamA/TamA family outer membrane protein [Bacteroidota bacterium]|nr:BamA/TamA family outer membrane protein [Bacteroidota bacterium]